MRNLNTLLAGLLAALALAACQETGIDTSYDMTLGSPSAPVEMVEYASVACPHCAKFNNEVFPAFKAKYIDTGKVHYRFREFLVGDDQEVSIALAGFLMARCAGKDKYFQVTDAIFRSLSEIEGPGGQPHAVLQRIALGAGLTPQKFEACIRDEKAQKALESRVQAYGKADKVESTPTFILNGKSYNGAKTLEEMDAMVAEAQSRGRAKS
jgi:protein-disulfide isomerase